MFITNLINKITNFRVKIGDKLNTLKSQIGQLNLLTTNDKTSLVGAVNEVNNKQEDYIPLTGTKEDKPLKGTIEFSNTSVPILKGSISAGKDFSIKQDSENNLLTTVSGDGNYSLLHQHKDGILLGTVVKGDITSNLGISGNSITLFSPGDINTRGAITGASDYSNYLSTNKLLYAQRIYVDKAISNFKLPTNWESPQQRFSGLVDKSADATYDKVMVLDNNGKAGTKNLDYAIPYEGANQDVNLNKRKLGNVAKLQLNQQTSTDTFLQLPPNNIAGTLVSDAASVKALPDGTLFYKNGRLMMKVGHYGASASTDDASVIGLTSSVSYGQNIYGGQVQLLNLMGLGYDHRGHIRQSYDFNNNLKGGTPTALNVIGYNYGQKLQTTSDDPTYPDSTYTGNHPDMYDGFHLGTTNGYYNAELYVDNQGQIFARKNRSYQNPGSGTNNSWLKYLSTEDLTTQLSNYVPINGATTINNTKTFTSSPIVPNGTLDSHAVNLGQLNSLIPIVNDGKLTLTTGTGLSGSAIFTADQSGNSSFSVGIASTHKLPTIEEWNALPTTNTITRLRGTTSGTYASGDLTLLAGSNVSIAQSGNNFTINATDTNTTYTAGNGLTLTGTTFGQTITTSGTGTFVTGITQTANGFQINLGTPPNTVYSTDTLAILNAGTSTSGALQTAKNLNDWLNGKGFSTQTLSAGSGVSIVGSVISNSAPNIDQKLSISGMKITLDRSGGTVTVPSSNLVTSSTATGTTNVATTNTNTYLNIVEGGTTLGSSTQVTGAGSVTVSSDANGKLTINGTNTTYGVETLANLNTGTSTTGLLQSAKNLNDWLTGKGYALASSIPTVNNGALTLTTGTGLSGSANFTANQSGNSSFSVSVASTHKLPTVAEFNNILKKNESNTITEEFEITNEYGTMRIGDYGAIYGEIAGISKIDLGTDDGYAVWYEMTNGMHFNAHVNGIQGVGRFSWYLEVFDGESRMSMPVTGNTKRVLTTGAKVGATTYYANNQGVIELPGFSAYLAGNGLTLSGNTFSLPVVRSGSGNVVSSVTQTANGISVTKGISAMTTSHLANLIDQNLNKVAIPTFNSIELSANTPFIDFHYNKSSADYTSRIIESGLGKLEAIVKDRFIVKYDGVITPFLEIDRYKAILGANVSGFEAVYLKTVFGSLNFDDEGLIYRPDSQYHSFGIESNVNVQYDIELQGKLNDLKINGRGSLGTPADIISGNKLTGYVLGNNDSKNGIGTFRVESGVTINDTPVLVQYGASLLVQSGDTMFTLSANPFNPEIFVSAGTTEKNVRWNRKLAFSYNEFPLYAQAFYENSLRKLKENIKPFDKSGLELINSLDIVTFDRKDSEVKNKIGIIADDSVDEVLSNKKDAVDLYNTIFIQAKAIQELSDEVVKLKDINNSLEERLKKIEKLLNL